MATARTSQAHEKRVQKIAEEAASKIAADAPLEEEVIVVVEELPPGEPSRSQRGRSTRTEQDVGATMLALIAQNQMLVADGISRWAALAAPFGTRAGSTETLGGLFDVRRMTHELSGWQRNCSRPRRTSR